VHSIEPYYNWRHLYSSEEDKLSAFFGREHSEFEFTQTVYNYYIHPQWDDFGSSTLYLKVLYADYELGFSIIEFIGEWNDAIENDIMTLKRDVIDKMIAAGITKFILIAENVLNFHSSDDCYYEEWIEDIQDAGGWVAMIGMPEHSRHDFIRARIHHYVQLLELNDWRPYTPANLFMKVDNLILKRLNNS
jgi:hypothetical protein